MDAIVSQITSLTIVYSTVYSDADQRKHQSSESLAFVWGIHRGPVNSPHKWPVTRKMSPFDNVIMVQDYGISSTVMHYAIKIQQISGLQCMWQIYLYEVAIQKEPLWKLSSILNRLTNSPVIHTHSYINYTKCFHSSFQTIRVHNHQWLPRSKMTTKSTVRPLQYYHIA